MDIMGRQDQVLAGGLSSDAMFMSWPSLINAGLGMLVMSVGIDYRQPVRRIFELGPGVVPIGTTTAGVTYGNAAYCDLLEPNDACKQRTQPTYYIVGRPEGRLQMQRIIGPATVNCQFYRVYGSPCGSNILRVTGRVGCSASDSQTKKMAWVMGGVVLDGLSFATNAQEQVMNEAPSAMFAGLKVYIDGNECNAIPPPSN